MLACASLLATIASCNGNVDTALWRDDFETVCDGAPCGWTQVAGPPGAVTWIETLPSEHGIQITGTGVAITRMATGNEVPFPDQVRSLKAHVVARCDPGSQLTLIVTVHNTSGGPPIDASGSATFPSTWDGTRTIFDLFASDAANATAMFDDIVNVVLHKEGPGVCEVDYISLADDNTPFFE